MSASSRSVAWAGWATLALVVAGTIALFLSATQGFRVVTSDAARQRVFEQAPRALPAIPLVDSQGRHTDLRTLAASHRYTVVTLVYTQCTSLCLLTASSEAYVQDWVKQHGLQDDVHVVTLSFDPARDTPGVLARYARRLKADAGVWTVATVADPADLGGLLEAFDVVVIPDGHGDYVHNGALFLVDADGRVFAAIDAARADVAFERLRALAGGA